MTAAVTCFISRIHRAYVAAGASIFVRGPQLLERSALLLLVGAGTAILIWGTAGVSLAECDLANPNAPDSTCAIDEAICWLLYFQEGSYGALLAAVSGLGALVAAAMGAYRSAMNCLVICLGTFTIRPLALLFFEYMPSPDDCTNFINRATGQMTHIPG